MTVMCVSNNDITNFRFPSFTAIKKKKMNAIVEGYLLHRISVTAEKAYKNTKHHALKKHLLFIQCVSYFDLGILKLNN